MDKHEDFFAILQKITIDNTTPQEKALELFSPAAIWLQENTPTELYRFFSGCDRNIDALERNEIWGSRPYTFNDPFECLPCYDQKQIDEILETELNFDRIKHFFDQIRDGTLLPGMGQCVPTDLLDRWRGQIGEEGFYENFEKQFPAIKDGIKQFFIQQSLNLFFDFYKSFSFSQYFQYVSCFTENRDASLMWAHYADSHKGFCLQFNWKKEIQQSGSSFLTSDYGVLAPVRYAATRYDATSHMPSIMEQLLCNQGNIGITTYFPDTLVTLKALLTKSFDWQYENEWRLITFSYDPNNYLSSDDYRVQRQLKPTCVYIGAKMPVEQANKIYQICINQNIECYKMYQSYSDKTFCVHPLPYEPT